MILMRNTFRYGRTLGEKIVYDGDYGDVPEHMNYAEVSSIDNVYADNKGVICLNVWSVN